VAGAVSLSVKEVDLKETLELLAERHGHEPPDAASAFPPWVPDEHPLSEVPAPPLPSAHISGTQLAALLTVLALKLVEARASRLPVL
jgi:hypothetical protein